MTTAWRESPDLTYVTGVTSLCVMETGETKTSSETTRVIMTAFLRYIQKYLYFIYLQDLYRCSGTYGL